MPIIKPKGLLRGDRMSALSDEARLYWPFLYAGSNGYGRFEMDYTKIVARCFQQFEVKPSRQQIVRLMREYRERCLLFVYTATNGQKWAAWDSAAVQSFYTKEDEASPVPPEPAFSEWKRLYQENKSVTSSDYLELDEVSQDEELASVDIKNAEIDISPKSSDTNRTSRSVSVSLHQNHSSVTSQHPNINANVRVLRPYDSGASGAAFEVWWDTWCRVRGSNHKIQAAQAWISVVTPQNTASVFECTTSYLASLSGATGYNPENFLFDQAQDGFSARWPPPQTRKPVVSKADQALSEFQRRIENRYREGQTNAATN